MTSLTLKPGRFSAVPGPVLTIVMDGVGLGPKDGGNAFHLAKTPVLDALESAYGFIPLRAHGHAVGLPSDSDLGNSEVGHNALGAGRVFQQGASLVEDAITSGQVFHGQTWQWLLERPCAQQGTLHFLGLLSDGNVHSHQRHLHALLRQSAKQGVKRVRIHVLLDGRDVGELSALSYVDQLVEVLNELNTDGRDYQIASGGGRMVITMDRYEAEWSMVERGWRHHVLGEGRRFETARQAIETLRSETGKTDQFMLPFVIADNAGPVGPIGDGDSVCLFNFRGDRAIEICRAFEEETLETFHRGRRVDVRFAGMMQYDGDLGIPRRFLVDPPTIHGTVGELLAYNGVRQFACSETQKYGHVTYFWNGNRSGYFDQSHELYVEVPSDVIPFEQRPWMKAPEIVEATLDALRHKAIKSARINLANGDMVGHTGVLPAAIEAMQAVDHSVGRLLEGVKQLGGVALVVADHGNCEEMYERDKKSGTFRRRPDGTFTPRTSHTINPVPFCLYDPHGHVPVGLTSLKPGLGLGNLAATTLDLLGYAAPGDYEPSLLSG
jgi:2,3-bisphosphoglycerate-independent phosphoglycerate mutase